MPLHMSEENVLGFGKLLHISNKESTFENKEFSFVADAFKFASEDFFTVGILTGYRREIKIDSLEKHSETVEILIQLENDAIVFLAKPSNDGEVPHDIESFYFKQGEAIALLPGVWHWVPYPEKSEFCKTLVIFKDGTSAKDCVIKNLSEH